MPSRADLARALRRLVATDTVMQGAADHGVSEALYLADPDGNGIEIYRDRPRDEWPYRRRPAADGRRSARSRRAARPSAAERDDGAGLRAPDTVIGHVHLHVSRLDEAERFYVDVLGFELMQRYGPSALFVVGRRLSPSHRPEHVGRRRRAAAAARRDWPAPFRVTLPTRRRVDAMVDASAAAGITPEPVDDGLLIRDPAKNAILLRPRI